MNFKSKLRLPAFHKKYLKQGLNPINLGRLNFKEDFFRNTRTFWFLKKVKNMISQKRILWGSSQLEISSLLNLEITIKTLKATKNQPTEKKIKICNYKKLNSPFLKSYSLKTSRNYYSTENQL